MALESVFKLSVLLNLVDQLSGPLKKTSDETNESIAKMNKAGGIMLGAGTAIVGVGAKLAASTFDTQNALGELASLGVEDLEAVERAAKNFSDTWAGTTKSDFITAAYDIKSGIASLTDEGVAQFTELAALTGKATKSTTEEMGSLFATGYGIYKDFYEDMSDMEFGQMFSSGIATAVKNYKTSGSQMAQSISTLGATATNSNVPLEEQLAILGQLQTTMSGSEAATKYKAFLSQAAKAGEELGITVLDANNQLLSTPDILDALRGKYGETIDAVEKQELKKAFGTDEAVAMIDLLYGSVDTLRTGMTDLAGSMGQGTQATMEMAEAINSTPEQKLETMKQKLHNTAEEIGNKLLPTTNAALDKVNLFIDRTSAWISGNQETVQSILRIAGALTAFLLVCGGVLTTVGTIGKVVLGLYSAFSMVSKAITAVKAAMAAAGTATGALNAAFLACPAAWIIAGIAALVAIIMVLWNRSEAFRNFWLSLFSQVKSTVMDAWQAIKPSLAQLGAAFGELWQAIQPLVEIIGAVGAAVLTVIVGTLMGALKGAAAAVAPLIDAFRNVVEFITIVIHAVAALFTGDFSGAMEYAKNAVGNLKDFVVNAFDGIVSFLGGFADGFLSVIDTAFSAVGIDISGQIETIKTDISDGMEAVKGIFSDVMTAAGDTVREKLDNIKSAYEEHGGGVEGIVAASMETVKGYYTAGLTFIDNLTGGKLTDLKNRFKAGMETIRTAAGEKITDLKNRFDTGLNDMLTAAGEKLDSIRNTFEAHGGGIEGIMAATMKSLRGISTVELNMIDNITGGKLTDLKNGFKAGMETIRTAAGEKITDLRNRFDTGLNDMLTAAGEKLDGIRNTFEAHGGGIEGIMAVTMGSLRVISSTGLTVLNSLTGGRFENIRKTVQDKLTSARETATSTFESIRTGIREKIDGAADTVKTAIERMKGFFKFEWSLPKLKLPTIEMDGKWSMNPPQVPKFSVKWNAEGAILNGAQIFGQAGDKLLGGGEAGQEAVLPLDTLWSRMGTILRGILNDENDEEQQDTRNTGASISKYLTQRTQTVNRETIRENHEKETVTNTKETRGETVVNNYYTIHISPELSEIRSLSLLQDLADEIADAAGGADPALA